MKYTADRGSIARILYDMGRRGGVPEGKGGSLDGGSKACGGEVSVISLPESIQNTYLGLWMVDGQSERGSKVYRGQVSVT